MAFNWANRRKSKIFDACYICAKNCINEGRYDIAKILLEKAIRYKRNDVRAYFLLADVLEKMDKKQEALKIYREVMVITEWKTKDENFKRASQKINYLTDISLYPMD